LRAAVREVLETPSYRESAQRLAAGIAAAPGPARAAELLEQLAGAGAPGGQPVLADRASA
jgi:UDP:flavonoid glycosyltransferase YjiC (YdhE family)